MHEPLNEADHDAYWRPLGQLLVQRGLLTNEELEAALNEQDRTGDLLGEILLRNGLLSRARTERPLGQLLVQRGLLTNEELEAALSEQDRTGDLLGEILLRNGLLSKLALASSLHEQSLVQEHESGFGSGFGAPLGAPSRRSPTSPATSPRQKAASAPAFAAPSSSATTRRLGPPRPVERGVDLPARLRRYSGHALELLGPRGEDPLRRAEVPDERAAARRPDSG